MPKMKVKTFTSLTLEALRAQDDFMDNTMLMHAIGCNRNQLTAATHHLRKRHAIDCVIEPNGKAWWYALPECSDDRTYAVEERTPESKPRNRARRAKS